MTAEDLPDDVRFVAEAVTLPRLPAFQGVASLAEVER
jgi:hypothetical protein